MPAFTWHSLATKRFSRSIKWSAQPSRPPTSLPPAEKGVFKQRWASCVVLRRRRGRPDPTDRQAAAVALSSAVDSTPPCAGVISTAAETGQADAELSALLDESGPGKDRAERSAAPTLIIQGEDDTLFTLDQADANFRALPRHARQPR